MSPWARRARSRYSGYVEPTSTGGHPTHPWSSGSGLRVQRDMLMNSTRVRNVPTSRACTSPGVACDDVTRKQQTEILALANTGRRGAHGALETCPSIPRHPEADGSEAKKTRCVCTGLAHHKSPWSVDARARQRAHIA